jgi:hypothetical protein
MELYEELINLKIPQLCKFIVEHKELDWLIKRFYTWVREYKEDTNEAIELQICKVNAVTYPYCPDRERLFHNTLVMFTGFQVDNQFNLLTNSGKLEDWQKFNDHMLAKFDNPLDVIEGNLKGSHRMAYV